LVGAGASRQVLASSPHLSDWHTVASEATLAASPAERACAPTSLDAVAYLAGDPVVAGSCAQPSTVGIFADSAGGWQLAGPVLPVPLAGDTVHVVAFQPEGSELVALLTLSSVRNGTSVAAAWTTNSGGRWSLSPLLHLNAGEQVASIGPATSDALFVLLSSPSGANRLETLAGPVAPWKQLSPPPTGTATVAFKAPNTADALVVDNTLLTVWTLRPSSIVWTKGQVIQVPIQFGSSN
jgi:hypothetical protein